MHFKAVVTFADEGLMQVLVDPNAGTKVSELKLRGIPSLRGDVAAYVRLYSCFSLCRQWSTYDHCCLLCSVLQDIQKMQSLKP